MITYNDPSAIPPTEALLPVARRRWDQASEALGPAREAEDYQAIGMRLRECLVSLIGEITNNDLVPDGTERPKAADFFGAPVEGNRGMACQAAGASRLPLHPSAPAARRG